MCIVWFPNSLGSKSDGDLGSMCINALMIPSLGQLWYYSENFASLYTVISRTQIRIIFIKFNIISQITIIFPLQYALQSSFCMAQHTHICMAQHTYLHGTAYIFAWHNIHICMAKPTHICMAQHPYLHRSDNQDPALQEQILLHSLVANNIIVIISL